MSKPSEYAAFMGIFTALTAVLSAADSMLSASIPITGVRLGLANICIITVMMRCGAVSGGVLSLLRSGFVFASRGVTAGIMSLCGGILSYAAALLLSRMHCSCKFFCAVSSICHICGQLVVACILTRSSHNLYYIPILIPAAIVTGLLTGTVSEMITKRMSQTKS